jgi:hypothetical protein
MTHTELLLADILERDRQILRRIAQAGDGGAAAVAELYDLFVAPPGKRSPSMTSPVYFSVSYPAFGFLLVLASSR